MEFTVKKTDLERGLQVMQGIIEAKLTMPVLGNILLQAEDGLLRLRATDLEVGLETAVPCDLIDAGSTTLEARELYGVIKEMWLDDVHFSRAAEARIEVISGKIRHRLVEIPAVEFPRLPDFPAKDSFKLKGAAFAELLERVAFVLASDEPKQHKGSLFVVTPESLLLVATDGHRMAYVRAPQEGIDLPPDVPEYRLLLSRKVVQTILRFAPAEEVEMAMGENHVFFRLGMSVVSARLQEPKFPRYDRVIPRDNDRVFMIEVEQFLLGLKNVLCIAKDRTRPTLLALSRGDIHVTSINNRGEDSYAPLEGEYDGDELSVNFNGQYLMDFLQAVGSGKVRMELKDAEKAILMKPMGESPYEYLYVLMPMRM